MNRRRLLTVLSAAGVCLGSPIYPSVAHTCGGPGVCAGHRLVAALNRPSAAAAVGRAYLVAHADECDAGYLAHQIMERLHGAGEDTTRADGTCLRRAIAVEIRRDFTMGRVVSVDGWILSQTEARLCGLAALLAA
jgi:hypothetical protein